MEIGTTIFLLAAGLVTMSDGVVGMYEQYAFHYSEFAP